MGCQGYGVGVVITGSSWAQADLKPISWRHQKGASRVQRKDVSTLES